MLIQSRSYIFSTEIISFNAKLSQQWLTPFIYKLNYNNYVKMDGLYRGIEVPDI